MSDGQTSRRWANVYRALNGACGTVHDSQALADQQAGRDRVACVEFEIREGLGVAVVRLFSDGGGCAE